MKTKPKPPASKPEPAARFSKSKTVDVIALLNRIDFSPDNVVEAATMNSVLFVEAIEYRLRCLEDKTRHEMEAKRICAERELAIRKEASERGDKVTEGTIKAMILVDQDAIEATSRYQDAEVYEEYSKLVVEAFRMRRDCLRIVAEMLRSEGSIGRSMEAQAEEMTKVRQNLKNRFPGEE